MKVTRAQAEENRNRIIDVAGRLFRERGFDGIGLADLMKGAGLTHGGFYGHFKSKEDLIIQACGRAFDKARDYWSRVIDKADTDPFGAVVRFYLSEKHRDAPGKGCVMAALGPDAARFGDDVKSVFAQGIRHHLDLVARLLPAPSAAAKREKAMIALSQMVGALVLARAAGDPKLSAEILQAVETNLMSLSDTRH